MWSIGVNTDYGAAPDGVVVSCFGTASGGSDGCDDSASLHTDVTASGLYSANASGGVMITNTTGTVLSGYLVFYSDYSAFNPGGSNIGIGIDDPLTEAASFSSLVVGDAFVDLHSCSVGFQGESGQVFSPTTCGVESPDSSQTEFGIDLSTLGTNGSIQLPYSISISADFVLPPLDPVPEPAGVSLLAIGLATFALRKRGRT
jgi:hypothetical protein